MTSDGITKEDWEMVVDILAQIANATFANDDLLVQTLRKNLLHVLESLEKKYGTLPSIGATKAECVESSAARIAFLVSAWEISVRRKDKANLVFISSSIAQLVIEEEKNMPLGWKWLDRLEEALSDHWEDEEYQELQRLTKLCQNS